MAEIVRPRILLGEDEEDDVVLFQLTLKKAEVNPDLVVLDSGAGILDHLKRLGTEAATKDDRTPDLIFLDGQLHHQPSMGLLRWIVSNPATKHIPVIILTGSLDPGIIEEATAIGAAGCFEKPFTPEDWRKVQDLGCTLHGLRPEWPVQH